MEMKKTKSKPRVISLFSGAGGFDLGFVLEGYEIVWAIDSSKMACKTCDILPPPKEAGASCSTVATH